jgi:hypothetical protein
MNGSPRAKTISLLSPKQALSNQSNAPADLSILLTQHSTLNNWVHGGETFNVSLALSLTNAVLFTALGTLFAVSLRPRFATLFQNKEDISEAVKAGLRVLEKVSNINSLLQQCHQYFNKLQTLAEERTMAAAAPKRFENGTSHNSGDARLDEMPMDQDVAGDAINQHIFGDWDDLSGIAHVFNDPLLPEFGADLFNFG